MILSINYLSNNKLLTVQLLHTPVRIINSIQMKTINIIHMKMVCRHILKMDKIILKNKFNTTLQLSINNLLNKNTDTKRNNKILKFISLKLIVKGNGITRSMSDQIQIKSTANIYHKTCNNNHSLTTHNNKLFLNPFPNNLRLL